MKNTIRILFCLALILLTAQSLWAKEKYTVAVLPFSVHSSENIDYVRQGIGDMLVSRISVSNRIEVTGKDVVSGVMKKTGAGELNLAEVYRIGRELKSDYVVWGSITKIGQSISIDGKLVDIAGGKSDVGIFTQSQTLDDVIPKINDFSQRIVGHILGAAPQAVAPVLPAAPPVVMPPQAPGTSREAQIISGMKTGGKKGTLTSMINPDFINAQDPMTRKGFWMSQNVKTEFKGMDIGDVNKDGMNEIVVIDQYNVYIYQKTNENLKLLKKIQGKKYLNYIAVDVADINKNGIPEIIVTALNEKTLTSFVLEHKDGNYTTIASDIRYFMRVIETPSGIPLLIGQNYGFDKVFETQIYEIVYRDGRYVSGDKMKFPMGLSVYGLTLDTLGSGTTDKIIALDELDYLCVIGQTDKTMSRVLSFGFSPDELIWRSDVVYGGSNNYIANTDKLKSSEATPAESAYANLRILTYDTNNDGKKEVIIVKNLSSIGRVFKNIKLFTSSEVYNLEWDGLGMAENWRTKKINGYVADYALKDVDNDGKPELVLALVQSVGASVSERSVIVVYKMDTPQ
jgi:TolB-like protein